MTLLQKLVGELADHDAIVSAERALTEELSRRGIHFGDGLLPTYCVPFYAESVALDGWIRSSELLSLTVEEVAQEALRDPAMMRSLHLRPEARDWVEIEPGYRTISVLARPDAIFVDGAIRYVEYNSDSPAMMAFSDHVAECLLALPHVKKHAAHLRTERMLPRLHATLLSCYADYGGATRTPTIAIIDWPGQKTRFEHARIAEFFETQGCPTLVCDPRELRYVEGKLQHEGRIIDLVYRRALFTELLDRASEVTALVDAYRAGAVCMVNPLRSYLASSKTLLAHLCANWPAARGECPVLPTRILDAQRIAQLRLAAEHVVLKKGESHGGLHVLLPGLASDAERQVALDDALSSPWIEQTYAELPKLRVPQHGGVHEKFYNWNPFLFGCKYAGGIARASDTPLINITLGGGLLPTVRVV